MAKFLDKVFGKRAEVEEQEDPVEKRVSPMKTIGTSGAVFTGGFIEDPEENALLRGQDKYRTYSNMLANVSIVAAGVRYFLNLTAKAEWVFTPSEHDTEGVYAKMAADVLKEDPRTSWHRIVRRAAMYRFYGFSLQEWTARRRPDGVITFSDIAPRAQRSIARWDVEDTGDVQGVWQLSPQTQRELYIPRGKCLYLVDDTLTDSPEGLGLFRHLVAAAHRLKEYERLEGVGFETDLRGVPVARGPFTELARMVTNGEITKQERDRIESPVRDFITNHIKGPKLGMLLDSAPYTSEDEAGRPSSVPQWEIDLLKAGATSLPELAASITRVNREMARVLGVEQLMLGEDSAGSFALSKDKTNSFFLLVDGTLLELAEMVRTDLLWPIWQLNGWPEEMFPKVSTEAIRYQDIDQITAALRDLAVAGAPVSPEDEAVGEVYDLLGLTRPLVDEFTNEGNALLNGGKTVAEGSTENPETEMPEDETRRTNP